MQCHKDNIRLLTDRKYIRAKEMLITIGTHRLYLRKVRLAFANSSDVLCPVLFQRKYIVCALSFIAKIYIQHHCFMPFFQKRLINHLSRA